MERVVVNMRAYDSAPIRVAHSYGFQWLAAASNEPFASDQCHAARPTVATPGIRTAHSRVMVTSALERPELGATSGELALGCVRVRTCERSRKVAGRTRYTRKTREYI